jgi:hypothetical protein
MVQEIWSCDYKASNPVEKWQAKIRRRRQHLTGDGHIMLVGHTKKRKKATIG